MLVPSPVITNQQRAGWASQSADLHVEVPKHA